MMTKYDYVPDDSWTDCPRNFTFAEVIVGLKTGATLCMDRIDAPERKDLEWLLNKGFVTNELKMIDDQSSVLEWKWKNDKVA